MEKLWAKSISGEKLKMMILKGVAAMEADGIWF